MIDLTNKPEGATGYYDGPMAISFYKGDKYWNDLRNEWVISGNDKDWHAKNVVAIEREWTIYNNDKPLSELSDEQAAELFNHKRHGGAVQAKSEIGWLDSSLWNNSWVYRAKQKSERELFIDAAKSCYREDCGHSIDQIACIAYIMFDSGKFERKVLKVGE